VSSSPTRRIAGQVARFVGLGALNSVVTGALFVALAMVLPATLAYTISFATGIVIAVGLTPKFVFGRAATTRSRLRYVLWYVVVYLCGLGLVYVLSDRLTMGSIQTAVLTLAATASLSFIGAKVLFDQSQLNALKGPTR
jgi:putative flippase GtrA